jgi:hypothetical protein
MSSHLGLAFGIQGLKVFGDFLPCVEVFEGLKVSVNFIIQDYSSFSFQGGLQMFVNSTTDDMTLMGCHLKLKKMEFLSLLVLGFVLIQKQAW